MHIILLIGMYLIYNYVDKYLHKHKDINNFNILCNMRYYENVFFDYDKQTLCHRTIYMFVLNLNIPIYAIPLVLSLCFVVFYPNHLEK